MFLDIVGDRITQVEAQDIKHLFPLWSDEQISNCREYLRSLVILKISFNSWSDVVPAIGISEDGHLKYYQDAISVRLLYSFYFKCGDTDTFSQFAREISSTVPSISDCISMMDKILGRKANYLMLVDELERSSIAFSLCSFLCSAMDNFKLRLDFLFTNLDSKNLHPDRTGSKRPIVWITLHKPSEDVVKNYFGDYPNIPRLLLVEISGHWRAMELLLIILKSNISTLKWNSKSLYDDLSDYLMASLLRHFSPLTGLIIEACFSGNSYSTMDHIDGVLVSTLMSKGIILTPYESAPPKDLIFPDVSLLLVKHWAMSPPDKDEPKGRFTFLRESFRKMFAVDSYIDWSATSFEPFHCHWQRIYHYCRFIANEECRDLALPEFYRVGLELNFDIKAKIHFPKEMMVDRVQLSDLAKYEYNRIYLLGDSNPGFDSVIFYKSVDGKDIAVATENKFSRDYATTLFSLSGTTIEEMKYKRMNTVEALRQFGFSEDMIVLVFAVWRESPLYMSSQESLTNHFSDLSDGVPLRNILILRKKDLSRLYGPLSRRVYFGTTDSVKKESLQHGLSASSNKE